MGEIMFKPVIAAAKFSTVFPFTPARLFRAGAVGTWISPQPPFLFSDQFGLTQAQPTSTVYTAIDKSQNAMLGPEEWTDFGTLGPTAGYSAVGPEITTFTYKRDASGSGSIRSPNTLVAGKTYRISFNVQPGTTYTIGNLLIGGPFTDTVFGNVFGPTSRTFTVRATAAASLIFYFPSLNQQLIITNISIREVLGNHAEQPTSASRPTLSVQNGRRYLSGGSLNWTAPTGTYTVAYLNSFGPVVLENQSLSGATNVMQSSEIFEYIAASGPIGSADLNLLRQYLSNKA